MEATIEWKTREEGGRATPPLGEGTPPYATMVRFMEPNDPWPESSYAKVDTGWLAAQGLELNGRTIAQGGV
jgi:hypothetical protein